MASGENLGKLPIIDSRGFDEQGIHYIWRSFAERARIDAANAGNHGNQVMWRYGTGLLPATAAQFAAVTLQSFLTMDTWLSNLTVSAPKETLNSVRSQAEVIEAKPATAFDLCYLTGDATFSTPVTDMAVCDADPRLAKHSSPRQVAGGPLAENILKCRLKPLESGRVCPGRLLGWAVDAPGSRVPGWRVRLEPARHWPAAGGFAARLRRRPGRRAPAAGAGIGAVRRSVVS